MIAVAALAGCRASAPPSVATTVLTVESSPVNLPGLHNVIRVSAKLISGSSPEGDAGFESLRSLSVRSIITVDGAQPEVERARRFDLRYVHLPIGYDGISQEQANRLARAVRDLPGPIYLHCHHGKHRAPAAAAAVQFCLDAGCTAAAAIEIMKRAGTDPHYVGLFAAPNRLHRPTANELGEVAAEFPETAAVPALAQAMVAIDATWDHLTAIRNAGWKTPANHADLDPPHEALQLVEHYRELARSDGISKRSDDFRRWLSESETSATALETLLRSTAPPADIEKAFDRCRLSCTQCHAKYRDVPQQ